MSRLDTLSVIGLCALALSGCDKTGAYGEANSIIVAAPTELWEAVGDGLIEGLEPTIFTVRDERTFKITHQDPLGPEWDLLREFKQVLLIGSVDDPWIAEALEERPRPRGTQPTGDLPALRRLGARTARDGVARPTRRRRCRRCESVGRAPRASRPTVSAVRPRPDVRVRPRLLAHRHAARPGRLLPGPPEGVPVGSPRLRVHLPERQPGSCGAHSRGRCYVANTHPGGDGQGGHPRVALEDRA